jgi:hypothetical protein
MQAIGPAEGPSSDAAAAQAQEGEAGSDAGAQEQQQPPSAPKRDRGNLRKRGTDDRGALMPAWETSVLSFQIHPSSFDLLDMRIGIYAIHHSKFTIYLSCADMPQLPHAPCAKHCRDR